MIPSDPGACYSYVFYKAEKGFEHGSDSSTNINFYTYGIANPATKQLESIQIHAVTHGFHHSNPSVNSGLAAGWYRASSQVKLQASPVHGNVNQLSLISSQPETQNTGHQESRKDENTNSFTESVHLGYDSEGLSGGFEFTAVQSHTLGFSVQTEITDWSVQEQTDSNSVKGQWQYDMAWPVDNTRYSEANFGDNYQNWFSTALEGSLEDLSEVSASNLHQRRGYNCQVKSPPALSTSTQQTSNSISWRAEKSLIDHDGKMLINMDFSMSLMFHRLWCPVCCETSDCNPCNLVPGNCLSGDSRVSRYQWGSDHHCLEHKPFSYHGSWQLDATQMLRGHALLNSNKAVFV